MMEYDDGMMMEYNWHSEDVEAEILSSHANAAHRGKICVIKTVSWGPCSVRTISTDPETIYVRREDLKPFKPRINQKVALKTLLNILTPIHFFVGQNTAW